MINQAYVLLDELRDDNLIYPDSDGRPMADNTVQFRWIVTIKEGLDALYQHRDDVFVAGDLLWYPVEGRIDIRVAPDAMVVFGRPKGDRGSYMQWKEENIAPQVAFEILSPGNTAKEMERKLKFYDHFGVSEYYIYDPDNQTLEGWLRGQSSLEPIPSMPGWESPLLGILFQFDKVNGLTLYGPNGTRLLTYQEMENERSKAEQRADEERQRADEEQQRADAGWLRAEEEQQRAERLAAKLRSLGIDPDDIDS